MGVTAVARKSGIGYPRYRPSQSVKLALISRQSGRCAYCQVSFDGMHLGAITLDHVIAGSTIASATVRNHFTNVVATCGPCNFSKGNSSYVTYIKAGIKAGRFNRNTLRRVDSIRMRLPIIVGRK